MNLSAQSPDVSPSADATAAASVPIIVVVKVSLCGCVYIVHESGIPEFVRVHRFPYMRVLSHVVTCLCVCAGIWMLFTRTHLMEYVWYQRAMTSPGSVQTQLCIVQ